MDDVVITPIGSEPEVNASNTAITQTAVITITEPKAIREPYSDEASRSPLPMPKVVLGKH